MTIDSAMTPNTDSTQTIISSTASSTDNTSGMGTAGQIEQNMDSLGGKLYESLKHGSSNPIADVLDTVAAEV